MASKKALLGSQAIKVENMSGFDKSNLRSLSAPLGAIVPLRTQLCLPGNFNVRVKIAAQLPPLATDAFLRTHLKVEAFAVPMRLCCGGFQSWFAGEEVFTGSSLTRAQLPRLKLKTYDSATSTSIDQTTTDALLGPHSLLDYFDVHFPMNSSGQILSTALHTGSGSSAVNEIYLNLFPLLCYNLIYTTWYRNKLIERPIFAPPIVSAASLRPAAHIPYVSNNAIQDFEIDLTSSSVSSATAALTTLNGSLCDLRFRNYGDDYFTTALPSAQEGSPMSVDTTSGSFTISALRVQNALQHFGEINELSSPDFVAANRARYGADLSMGVAQKPILLGSADFPMYTSGVEQTAQGAGTSQANPFSGMAARYGRAHAEGSDFVCKCSINEPSYIMILCSVVPEATYSNGIPHDMQIFTQSGSLVDLPVAALEQTGFEPVYQKEVNGLGVSSGVFGYQNRYMWHKAGPCNGVAGLLRKRASLGCFAPQRDLSTTVQISTAFLKVQPTDLDGVMAVSGSLSQYGVIIDSAIDFFCSEPLGESKLPSLADPAEEHGRTVYVKRGGIGV